jgi:hydrogenase nickel incorporation protein HypB
LEYNIEQAVSYIHQVHPGMPVFQISAKTQQGFDAWIQWLKDQVREKVG